MAGAPQLKYSDGATIVAVSDNCKLLGTVASIQQFDNRYGEVTITLTNPFTGAMSQILTNVTENGVQITLPAAMLTKGT
jgi:hypothetical protein